MDPNTETLTDNRDGTYTYCRSDGTTHCLFGGFSQEECVNENIYVAPLILGRERYKHRVRTRSIPTSSVVAYSAFSYDEELKNSLREALFSLGNCVGGFMDSDLFCFTKQIERAFMCVEISLISQETRVYLADSPYYEGNVQVYTYADLADLGLLYAITEEKAPELPKETSKNRTDRRYTPPQTKSGSNPPTYTVETVDTKDYLYRDGVHIDDLLTNERVEESMRTMDGLLRHQEN